jgi:hypothetical protein
VFWVLSVVFLGRTENRGYLLIISLFLKIIIEKQVIGSVVIGYSFPSDWIDSIVARLAHPIYVMAVGVGVLGGKFNWEGRNNLRNVNFTNKIS